MGFLSRIKSKDTVQEPAAGATQSVELLAADQLKHGQPDLENAAGEVEDEYGDGFDENHQVDTNLSMYSQHDEDVEENDAPFAINPAEQQNLDRPVVNKPRASRQSRAASPSPRGSRPLPPLPPQRGSRSNSFDGRWGAAPASPRGRPSQPARRAPSPHRAASVRSSSPHLAPLNNIRFSPLQRPPSPRAELPPSPRERSMYGSMTEAIPRRVRKSAASVSSSGVGRAMERGRILCCVLTIVVLNDLILVSGGVLLGFSFTGNFHMNIGPLVLQHESVDVGDIRVDGSRGAVIYENANGQKTEHGLTFLAGNGNKITLSSTSGVDITEAKTLNIGRLKLYEDDVGGHVGTSKGDLYLKPTSGSRVVVHENNNLFVDGTAKVAIDGAGHVKSMAGDITLSSSSTTYVLSGSQGVKVDSFGVTLDSPTGVDYAYYRFEGAVAGCESQAVPACKLGGAGVVTYLQNGNLVQSSQVSAEAKLRTKYTGSRGPQAVSATCSLHGLLITGGGQGTDIYCGFVQSSNPSMMPAGLGNIYVSTSQTSGLTVDAVLSITPDEEISVHCYGTTGTLQYTGTIVVRTM